MALRSFGRGPLDRFARGDQRGVNPAHGLRPRDLLQLLDGPQPLEALSLPTYRLHPLHAKRAGKWSV